MRLPASTRLLTEANCPPQRRIYYEVVSRGKLHLTGQGGGHGHASALPVVADHVRDLETTNSPWQAHAA